MKDLRNIQYIILLFVISCVSSSYAQDNHEEHLYFDDVTYFKKHNHKPNKYLIESNYDYINVALAITKDCSTDYEKIRAIYKWICDNIEYDVSYRIYDADNCFDKRKGVCQAYCNLFYHIAKSIGIRTEIVGGETKDYYGQNSDSGHGWIFAYTDDYHGILMDPTWGAGTVNGNKFKKNNDCWIWFNVDPRWMILSHFPDDKSYQLLDVPISINKFYSMPKVSSKWIEYGLDPIEIYNKAISDSLSIPTFYSNGEGRFKVIDMPMQKSLKIGQFYTFRIKLLENNDIAIVNDDLFYKTDEWTYEGDGIYSISFMPRKTGLLSFSIEDRNIDNYWNNLIEYDIDEPTQRDWDNVMTYYPLDNPKIKDVKNLYIKEWNDAGVDDKRLAQLITENDVKELPIIYTNMGQNMKLVSLPINMELNVGTEYTFSFYPKKKGSWAVINEGDWFTEWQMSDDGKYTITVTPERQGKLSISVQNENDSMYYSCLGYTVVGN